MVCYVNFLSATSPDTMDGSPARSIALIPHLHVAGEEGGSATMVAVFLPVLPVGVVLCLSSRDVTRSTYVAVGTKKNKGGAGAGVRYVTLCPTLACTTPPLASSAVPCGTRDHHLEPGRCTGDREAAFH